MRAVVCERPSVPALIPDLDISLIGRTPETVKQHAGAYSFSPEEGVCSSETP